MKMKLQFALCAIFLGLTPVSSIMAQSIDRIKGSSEYLFGEGFGKTTREADDEALRSLISSISISVQSDFPSAEEEVVTNGVLDASTATRSVVSTYSQAILQNTEMIVVRTEPDAEVFRYIRKSDVDNIFKSRRAKLLDMLDNAAMARQKGSIDNALRYYYWSFCLLQSLPNAYTVSKDGNILVTWIPQQINEILEQIRFVKDIVEDNVVLLTVTYGDEPVTGLDYTCYDGMTWSDIYSACDGMGVVELRPGVSSDNIRVKCEYQYVDESHIDKEIAGVVEIMKGKTFSAADKVVEADKAGRESNAVAAQVSESVETNWIGSAIAMSSNETLSVDKDDQHVSKRPSGNASSDKSSHTVVESATASDSNEAAGADRMGSAIAMLSNDDRHVSKRPSGNASSDKSSLKVEETVTVSAPRESVQTNWIGSAIAMSSEEAWTDYEDDMSVSKQSSGTDSSDKSSDKAEEPVMVSAPKGSVETGGFGAVIDVPESELTILSDDEAAPYRQSMDRLISAIRQKNYRSVYDLFTSDGLDMYEKLIMYGKARILDIPELSFIQVGDEISCRSIPVNFSFSNNNRQFVEHVTFTFTKDGKIDCLAFGLDNKTSDDILHHAVWSEYARKILIEFIENYKTAYSLKRLDYLKNVFDDNAVIISGKAVSGPVGNSAMLNGFSDNGYVQNTRQYKQQYLANLERSFDGNEFINIRFVDIDVVKAGAGGEVYGIQIRQDYYSSNYGDTGYLFLMVDLNEPKLPVIKARVWHFERDPNFKGLPNF